MEKEIFDEWMELDREASLTSGSIASIDGAYVTVIGMQAEGKIEDGLCSLRREGYKKILRLIRQSEKFHRPIVLFVNGGSEFIAQNFFELSGLRVPVLSVITGDCGQGEELAGAISNEVCISKDSMDSLRNTVLDFLKKFGNRTPEELMTERYERIRSI